jgi:hypothetical protein
MKKLLFLTLMIISVGYSKGQSSMFNQDTNVMQYMEGKTFYNSDTGIELEYGYISSGNTYGIIFRNKNGAEFYFINVEITTYGSYADLYGMSINDGRNFGFRLYKGKLVVGKGEPEEMTFYLK